MSFLDPSRKVYLGIVAFWCLAIFGTYPVPFVDDSWYIGPAFNLVQHGVFSNNLCESMARVGSADFFLASMPLHGYVLAGWLWLFGINTLSLRLFSILLAMLVSLLIYRLMPKTRLSWLAAVFICLATYGLLGGTGLRQDALGLFFVLAGFDAWRAETPAQSFWKNFSLSLAVITYPTAGILGMLLSAAALAYQVLIRGYRAKQMVPYFLVTGAAYLISFVLFLLCIHGRLHDFLVSTGKNEHLTVQAIQGRFQLLTALGFSKWLAVQGSYLLVILVLLLKRTEKAASPDRLFFLALSVLGFLCLGYASFSSSMGAHVWAFACLMAGLFLLLHEKWGAAAWSLYTLVFIVAAYGHAHIVIQDLLVRRPLDREKCEALRTEVSRLNPERLYVDAYAMREIYGYKLPPNAYAFENSNTSGWAIPRNASQMRKNSVAVATVAVSFPTEKSPEAGSHCEPFILFGHPIKGLSRNLYDLDIIDNR